MELKLKIAANDFRNLFKGDDYMHPVGDGTFRAILWPQPIENPGFYIYELQFQNQGGPIIDIVRRFSLGANIPALENRQELSANRALVDEVATLLKTKSCVAVIFA